MRRSLRAHRLVRRRKSIVITGPAPVRIDPRPGKSDCPKGYRGLDVLRTESCTICGRQGQNEPVYHCSKFDADVTVNLYSRRQKLRCCKRCDIFWEDEEETEPTETIPVVWTFWTGAAQSDELRWSIRSTEKHFSGHRPEIWVAGDAPDWYAGNLIPIPRVADCRNRRFRDTLNKVHAICQRFPRWLWMMDDIYFLKQVTVDDLAVWRHQGRYRRAPGGQVKGGTGWQALKRQTFQQLANRGLPQYDYAAHLPRVIESNKWLTIWDEWQLATNMLMWELIYGNTYVSTHQHYGHYYRRVKNLDTASRVGEMVDPTLINNSNGGWSETLRDALWQMFPVPSNSESKNAV